MGMILRRLRGAVVNALVWALAWFGLGVGLYFVPRLWSGGPVLLASALSQGLMSAFVGFLLGGAFSLYLVAAFRHQRVEEIRAARFILGGALVTVLLLLVLMFLLNADQMADEVLTQPLALYGSILEGVALAAVAGGITAFGTIKLAQAGSDLDAVGRESHQELAQP